MCNKSGPAEVKRHGLIARRPAGGCPGTTRGDLRRPGDHSGGPPGAVPSARQAWNPGASTSLGRAFGAGSGRCSTRPKTDPKLLPPNRTVYGSICSVGNSVIGSRKLVEGRPQSGRFQIRAPTQRSSFFYAYFDCWWMGGWSDYTLGGRDKFGNPFRAATGEGE